MFNYHFGFGIPTGAQAHFPHNPFLLRVQTVQDILGGCDYPVWKHQKLENPHASSILDPDVFFKKEAEFIEEDHSVNYQNTEVSSLAMSPSRSVTSNKEYVYSSFSDILTPDQLSPVAFERKTSDIPFVKEDEEEIKTSAQLLNIIESKLTADNANLLGAIEQVLQGNINSVAELRGFSQVEEAVVQAILDKKDLGANSKKNKGKKREEEKQKFFFKGVLKYTEAKFFGIDANQKKRMKKKQLRKEDYYEHYWGQVAKEQDIDLSNFFHPNKKLSSGKTNAQISSAQNPGLKSLNTTYIDLILSSDKFRKDTIDYLDNVFLKETRNSRCQKVSKLICKLNSLTGAVCENNSNLPIHQQIEAVKTKIHDYLVVNPKSKLPWADNELKEARDFAYNTIIKQSSKNMKHSF